MLSSEEVLSDERLGEKFADGSRNFTTFSRSSWPSDPLKSIDGMKIDVHDVLTLTGIHLKVQIMIYDVLLNIKLHIK